ncbi:hypothetical protein METBIDRAFT_46250 [Metschnikowia bicuspidata var. bicuspidata NRRL YB-4993]|uniref:L-lactate dehydrogenase (cytochrome) n=1 Tax=Metschnikowia bicuspidata var. bicuspidata NRRL YB-4993 TaxID=869754 RepID=A0A1A0H6C1_9ASCO|nr:hypothetical protein METBIDRAFT_46250 [Metschnikowia bicuspidata var. bicuspidata NRRL YB-4993]OBA19576.1 hypothetical protein METBIDRAFT_46250 [Metschnikowia bicuspidata var. bicuspidata NRRL YB-4993]
MLSFSEVSAHNLKQDCWVIIHGNAYDVSGFVDEHPGGAAVILKYAGRDATKAFDPVHPGDTLTRYLPAKCHLGPVDMTTRPRGRPKTTPEGAPMPAGTRRSPDGAGANFVAEYDVEYDEQDGQDPLPAAGAAGGAGVSAAINDANGTSNSTSTSNGAGGLAEPLAEHGQRRKALVKAKPALSQMYNLHDFEYVAKHTMEPTAWAYYSSGADDETALRNNHLAYHRIFFNPKVLVDVSHIDTSTSMLGAKTLVPFYITATALGKLGHPDGEKVLTRAAARQDVVQMIPTLASCSFDEIVDAATGSQTQWFQLYVNADREITRRLVQHAERRGVKGLFVTVDAPQLGRREKDMRTKHVEDVSHVQGAGGAADRTQGAARAISSFIDPRLNWADLRWLRSVTDLPIVLKGVQSVADALTAADHGVDGIVLSNHGGRQLDSVRAPVEVLAQLAPVLRARGLFGKLAVFVDGGVRRASDVLKAVALGATGVGIGRPFLYAMSTYGDAGVERAIQILKDEMVMNMRLLGAPRICDLDSSFVDVSALSAAAPDDRLFSGVYEPLQPPEFRAKI